MTCSLYAPSGEAMGAPPAMTGAADVADLPPFLHPLTIRASSLLQLRFFSSRLINFLFKAHPCPHVHPIELQNKHLQIH